MSGASSAVFITTAHPAASAGASFIAIIPGGAFHGTIAPTIPIGSRSVATRKSYPGRAPMFGVKLSPLIFVAQPA